MNATNGNFRVLCTTGSTNGLRFDAGTGCTMTGLLSANGKTQVANRKYMQGTVCTVLCRRHRGCKRSHDHEILCWARRIQYAKHDYNIYTYPNKPHLDLNVVVYRAMHLYRTVVCHCANGYFTLHELRIYDTMHTDERMRSTWDDMTGNWVILNTIEP